MEKRRQNLTTSNLNVEDPIATMPAADGGLGTALVGEKIVVNSRSVAVTRLLGEGKNGARFALQ